MKRETKITSSGIKKVLKNYKYTHGVAEYIWNGFDAKANRIDVNYTTNDLGYLDYIEIIDNGIGIDLERLDEKFDRFYDSEKTIQIQSPKHTSVLHGKNGVGRLTFFTFAQNAEWNTIYKNGEFKSGTIKINSGNLKGYTTNETNSNKSETGTSVTFRDLTISSSHLEQEIIPFLKKEFCWFLELNKTKGYELNINGVALNYEDLIYDRDEFKLSHNKIDFQIRYIQWRDILNKEHSKFYFLDNSDNEIFKDFTTLNRKGDHFYHSVYISSEFFKDFDFKSNPDSTQINLFSKAKSSPEYKYLDSEINKYLRSKRKPFLREYASKMVEDYEVSGIFPEYKNSWEIYRKNELKDTIIGLYEAQPKVFTNLNLEQKKTFVRFLDLLLDSNEREHIFNILEEVTNLEPEEREELSSLFKTTRLDRIVSTIKLVEDRYRSYYILKELVFNEALKANEVNHLQTLIENNYWFFGEQYHLVTAAEPKFEEALRRYVYEISGEIYDRKIEHVDKNREMDIFACRQNKQIDTIDNIVVELKHPNKNIGEKEYSQTMKYINVIKNQPEFNASNMEWKFYLVGRKFDTSGFIDMQKDSNKSHGEKDLVLSLENGRIKFYVKKWSELFNEFELRHNFIDEKLKLEREQLYSDKITADEMVDESISNSANSKKEVEIP